MSQDLYAIKAKAEQLAMDSGGFPAQQQDPPGWTSKMDPIPDHGEQTWIGRERLSGLKALITGGDSGIGRAVAVAFAKEGADVALNYLPEEDSDAAVVREFVESVGRKCVLLPADLRDEDAARRVVDDAAEQLGGLNIVVNNAGFQWARREPAGLAGVETERLRQVYETNIYAMFWVSQQALQYLDDGDSIINVSSIQAYDPSPALIDYAATKAAINNFTVNLANDLGPKGIRVNAVAPGPIWTPLQPATKNGETMPEFGGDTPLGRAGQPAELAGAFVFLASPLEASYVTGTVIGVTGGKPVF